MKPQRIRPIDGGQLMSAVDAGLPSFPNYARKLDWRRELDREMVREGHLPFQLIEGLPGNQCWPQNQDFPVTGFGNGGFELDEDGDGVPDLWEVSGGTQTLDIDADFSEGEQSVKLVCAGGSTVYLQSDDLLPVIEGYLWKLTISAKASVAGRPFKLQALWYDEDGAALTTVTLLSTTAGTSWMSYGTQTASPPVDARFGRVRILAHESTDATASTLWFDGVTLVTRDAVTRPINLVHLARRPNGQSALVVGTATTLYRFYSYSGNYYSNLDSEFYYTQTGEGTPYYATTGTGTPYYSGSASGSYYTTEGVGAPYYSTQVGLWKIIGSGFSETGRRWEALSIDGYSVFNNGKDLPVTYRVEDAEAKPIYELREMGIAYAGTIAKINSALVCMDLGEINEDYLPELMAHEDGGAARVWQNGAVLSPYTATGYQGYARRFNGTTALADAADSLTLDMPSGKLTMEAHFKVAAFDDVLNRQTILCKLGPSGVEPYCYMLQVVNNRVRGYLRDALTYIESSPISEGEWYHVAVTCDVDTDVIKLYLNGELDATLIDSSSSAASFTSTGVLRFGADYNSANLFNGDIAELRLFALARTADQIRDKAYDTLVSANGLVGYWTMDDAVGVTLADSSPWANTSTANADVTRVTSTSPVDSFVYFDEALDDILDTPSACAGRKLLFSNGSTMRIKAKVSNFPDAASSSFKVDGDVTSLLGGGFTFWIVNDIAGDEYTVGRTSGSNNVTGTDLDVAFYIGLTVQITDGTTTDYGRIVRVGGTTTVQLDKACTVTGSATMTAVSDYSLFCDTDYFTPSMVGRKLFLSTGETRRITSYVNPRLVEVNAFRHTADGYAHDAVEIGSMDFTADTFYLPGNALTDGDRVRFDGMNRPKVGGTKISEQLFYYARDRTDTTFKIATTSGGAALNITDSGDTGLTMTTEERLPASFKLESSAAYGRVNDAYVDRIQYRVLWGQLNAPRRFASAAPGSIAALSKTLELDYPCKSFEAGMELTIPGAGALEGNLTATITSVHENGTTIRLDTKASYSVDSVLVQASDAATSIAGFTDLSDDSSPILRAMELDGRLVIYKGASNHVMSYTGDAANPFNFQWRPLSSIEGGPSHAPFYRNTLVNTGKGYHIYASHSNFYKYDLSMREPERMEAFELAGNLFYDNATKENMEEIYAGHNGLTGEIFFMAPSDGETKGLAFDYIYGTVSELGAAYTAVATILKPSETLAPLEEQWCVLGQADGRVCVYGKADEPQAYWGGAKEVYSRNGAGYQAKLLGGALGDGINEVGLAGYLLETGTQALTNGTPVTVSFYGYRNTSEQGRLLGTRTRDAINSRNLIKTHLQEHWLQDEIVVDVLNGPFSITARSVMVNMVQRLSMRRR